MGGWLKRLLLTLDFVPVTEDGVAFQHLALVNSAVKGFGVGLSQGARGC